MNDNDPGPRRTRSREPWNKGKLIGPKPPLRPSHVWSIRTKLQLEGRTRDLALFNLAIDSKLRGCDVVAVRVDDVVLRDNLDEKGGGDQSFEAAAGSGVMIVADLKLCKGFFGAAV